jgi:hypothetical protein
MRHVLITLVGVLLFLGSSPVMAQDRFGVELRIGPDFATQDFGDANLNTGFGSELVFSYQFIPRLAGYAGFGYGRSTADGNSFVGSEAIVEETGYTFGVQFIQPVRASRYGYFLRAGGVYNHLEIEDDASPFSADSGHGFGWQIGAGPVVTLGQNWKVMPGLRYRSLSRDVTIGDVKTDLDRTYFSAGVGVMRTF